MFNFIHIAGTSCFKKLTYSFLIFTFTFFAGDFVQAETLSDNKTELGSFPAPPIAYFTTNKASGCSDPILNFPIIITDESVGATYWRYRIFREATQINEFIYGVQPGPFPYTFTNNTSFPIEYTIELLVKNPANQENFYSRVITVYPSINAQFSQTLVGGAFANPRAVEFTNQSSSNTADNYFWSFGDGGNYSSTLNNEVFTHNFENLTNSSVTYDVSLVAQSSFGCRDTATSQVSVTSYFLPQFDVSHTVGCAPLNVMVTNRSLGNVASFSWTITGPYAVAPVGANTNSFTIALQNPGNTPANYTITLTVTNTGGCVKTLQKVVRVNPQVQVSFTPINSVICDSTEVIFATTLTDPSLPNISYNWNFGDGASSSQKNPTHIFRNMGNSPVNRTVTLSAVSEYGCSGTYTTTVRVHPYTKPEFTVSKAKICSGESITFTYQRMPSISGYAFDFGGYLPNTWPGDASANGTFTKQFINQTGAPRILNVRLTVTNTNGCAKTFTLPITINPEVNTDFIWAGDSPLGCNPLDVNFTNTTEFTGGAGFSGTYYWDFGDGTTSTELSPNHVFNNDNPSSSVPYTVVLTATSIHGCVGVETQTITVQPRLSAEFSIEQPDICVPSFTFYPASPGATVYNWNFDGLIPAETIPNGNTFTRTINPTDPENITTGTITLTVVNAAGCSGVATQPITIYPTIVPSFTVDEPVGCSDLEVTFSNSSTGGVLDYKWNFDDGQTYSTKLKDDFDHTFVNRGSTDRPFQVALTATNANGCSEVHNETIIVHPKVEADFSFTYDDPPCTPFNVAIVNSSLNGSTFDWNFGEALFWEDNITTLKANPEFDITLDNPTDNAIGNYSISVHASTFHALSGLTCEDSKTLPFGEVYPRVVANFGVDVDEGCNALDVQFTNSSTGLGSYSWDFDDGSFSDEEDPSKTFAHINKVSSEVYTVRLTSTNKFGCKNIAERDITVYPLVEAAFALSDDDGCTPLTTYTSNSAVSPVYVYSWDFGDGQTSTLAQPDSVTLVNNIAPLALFKPEITLETSLNQAIYTVGNGCAEIFSKKVTVYPHIFPDFTANLDGCHPLPVEFTNTTETIGGTDNATYLWSFGNGVTSNFTDFSQNYYNPSLTRDTTFTVWLRGYSEYGCADSTFQEVTVYPKPQSIMELVSNYFACSPYEIEIQNLSKGKTFGTTLEFYYDFGDGDDLTTFSGDNIFHNFTNLTDLVEPYTVALFVESENGCQDTSYQTIYVYPEVTASFDFDPGDAACSPFIVSMENSSTNSSFYRWSFGDGVTSNLFEPFHRFVNNTMVDQVFDVSLVAISEYNCKDSIEKQITVYSAPDANFKILPPLKVFPDAQFAFDNITFPSSDSWTYTWTFGDGYGSSDKDPLPHEYSTWGPVEDNFQYLVSLTVENANCSDMHVDFLTLRPPVPIAYFEANDYEACSPLEVYFDNLAEYYYTNPDSTAFLWDFGDGTTSNEKDPVHAFHESGFYNVSLTVFGDGGISTFFWVFRVHENPVAMFTVTPQVVILPDANVHIYNLSENATSYIWDLGDGTIAYTKDVVHSYSEVGEYGIHLTAITDYGCIDTTSVFPAVWVKGAGTIRFPNAFVPSKLGPNGGYYDDVDFSNEIFHPIAREVGEFKMLIFNRWGEQIFESNDIKIGWDGYYKGKLCSQDVYVYRAIGKYSNGYTFEVRGNVTLLR